MKSDLSKVKAGDKIWTIQDGWTKIKEITQSSQPKVIVENGTLYTLDGKYFTNNKYPSAFLEYPFGEEPIEKDTLVWFRDDEEENWMIGYYSHFKNGNHYIFDASKKSTETDQVIRWNIATTENPLVC